MTKSNRRAKSARDLKRRAPFRTEPARVLIVTEGSKTEPEYFNNLIQELGLTTARVKIVGDSGSAPISVVEEAFKRLKQDSDYEQVYCVFDRDRHASFDDAILKVKNIAANKDYKGKVIEAITSVPCFELWYLLHVSDSRRPYQASASGGSPAEGLISELKKITPFQTYEKSSCSIFYDTISAARSTAIERAESFLSEAKQNGDQEFRENPSTRVHKVVIALQKISANLKKENEVASSKQ